MSFLLIVDDDPGVSGLLSRLARRALAPVAIGTVASAASPEEAISILEKVPATERPVLVMSDYNMGTAENGLQLLAEVGRRWPEARRVLMSGYPKRDFEKELDAAGLDGFVPKPFDIRELADLLSRLLAGAPAGDRT